MEILEWNIGDESLVFLISLVGVVSFVVTRVNTSLLRQLSLMRDAIFRVFPKGVRLGVSPFEEGIGLPHLLFGPSNSAVFRLRRVKKDSYKYVRKG